MKLIIASFLFFSFISSCTKKNVFPEKKSNNLFLSELHLETNVTNVQQPEMTVNKEFSSIIKIVNRYNSRNVNFNLSEFESAWESIYTENNNINWSVADSVYWVETTGLLLELTGQTKYADVLENIYLTASNKIQQEITPYILTKRVDHIYVNVFQAIETTYSHTLGGDVSFKQETNYPESGSVKLYFGMTERQYIELYIRIPNWAEGTTVTVKHVKYVATPGTYCKIAKKWKEGDLVEIEFPIEKMP